MKELSLAMQVQEHILGKLPHFSVIDKEELIQVLNEVIQVSEIEIIADELEIVSFLFPTVSSITIKYDRAFNGSEHEYTLEDAVASDCQDWNLNYFLHFFLIFA